LILSKWFIEHQETHATLQKIYFSGVK